MKPPIHTASQHNKSTISEKALPGRVPEGRRRLRCCSTKTTSFLSGAGPRDEVSRVARLTFRPDRDQRHEDHGDAVNPAPELATPIGGTCAARTASTTLPTSYGGTKRLFSNVHVPSTIGILLHESTFGQDRQLGSLRDTSSHLPPELIFPLAHRSCVHRHRFPIGIRMPARRRFGARSSTSKPDFCPNKNRSYDQLLTDGGPIHGFGCGPM